MGYYRKIDTHTNLLVYSEEIDVGSGTAAWNNNGNGLTVTQNAAVAPDGTMTAETLEQSATVAANRSMRQDYTSRAVTYAGEWFTHSIWARKVSGDDATPLFRLNLIADGTPLEQQSQGLNLTSKWKRFDHIVQCPSDASTYVQFAVEIGWDTDGAAHDNVIAIWGAQAVRGRSIEPYIPTTSAAVTAATRRDNHWGKDHNGIWRRHLRLEGPRSPGTYTPWANLVDYSAGPFNESPGGLDFWDSFDTIASWENVASCIEGGRAVKATSTDGGAPRYNLNTGTYSGNIEVVSGIYERVGSEANRVGFYAYGNPSGTHAAGVYVNGWSPIGLSTYETGNGSIIDSGIENLGIGPNGGQLVRIWMAYDTSVANYTGETRYNQWRLTNEFSGVETGIMHHAQLIEIPSGYSFLDNGAPTGPIVNLGATNNAIAPEQFSIPISFNPQALTVYVRFIQRWRDGDHTVFCIGDGTGERLKLTNSNGTTGTYFFRHHDGTAQVQDTGFGLTTDFGDTIEFVGTLFSDGSVQGRICKNGGSWVVGTRSAGLTFTGSWAENLVHIGSFDDSNNGQGFMDFEAFKIASGQQTPEFMRGYKETGTYEY